MKHSYSILAFLLLGFLTACGKQDRPYELPKEYSVDLVVSSGGVESKIKTFTSGKMARSEMNAMGMNQVSIVKDQKVYVLMPNKKYMEMKVPDRTMNNLQSISDEAKWEKLGEEEIDGTPVIKWKVIAQLNPQQKAETTFWTDKKTGYPRRSQVDAAVVNWENFKPGPQEPSLFEVPADYTKLEMPQMPAMP